MKAIIKPKERPLFLIKIKEVLFMTEMEIKEQICDVCHKNVAARLGSGK